MPCADGELCLVPANSPKDPDGHGCQGGCGGRLHGICGSIADDENENHRMCSACVVKAGKRKAKAAEGAETVQEQAGKRKAKAAEGAGTGQSKRPNTKGGVLSASRKRLTIQEKVQILQLLDKRTSHEHIPDRFNCSERLVRKVKAEREVVEKEVATGDDEVVKAMREDAAEEMAAALAGTLSLSDSEEEAEGQEEEKEDGGDESAERGRDAPPAYAELSAHFGVLESAAEKSGNADAAHYLSKARMTMILAHAARRTRQADMREFIATE